MKKRMATGWLGCLLAVTVMAQYAPELQGNMPASYGEMKASLHYPLAWQNADMRFQKWKNTARSKLLECAASFPPDTAWNRETLAQEQRSGYTVLKIQFNLSAWQRTEAYLYVPDRAVACPAMLMLHDHGAHFSIGKEKMARPFDVSDAVKADADEWVKRCYDGVYLADDYAARGYVVLVADALMWGSRKGEPATVYDRQQALAANLLQMGYSLGGLLLHDDMRCLDFLTSLPMVDANRVGVLGFSMGAYRAWMLAAASDKVKAAAAVCWMCTTDALLIPGNNQTKGGSAYAMLIPNLIRWMDYPHVASIACPKPMLFFNGSRDKLSPVAGVEAAYQTMHEVWQSQKADQNLVTKIWDEKHFFSVPMQTEVQQFFVRCGL